MSSEFPEWSHHGRVPPARILLRPHRFSRGWRYGSLELSPALPAGWRRHLAQHIKALPTEFLSWLPRIKVASTAALRTPQGRRALAASFIPHGYVLLSESLFSRRGELGRIFYHELCHFLWPRLGNGRRIFEAAIAGETARRKRGELGYSASLAKFALPAPGGGVPRSGPARTRAWRHYLCESFCDTGAYVLLRMAGFRRARHSEWTLGKKATAARVRAWRSAVGW